MEKLKALRKEQKLSNRAMGDLLGVSKVFYWRIENDKRRLSYDMAYKIAKIFNTKPDDIFYEETKAKFDNISLPEKEQIKIKGY